MGRVNEDVLTHAIYYPVQKLAQNWPIFSWHYPFKHIWELFLWPNVTREYFENLFPTFVHESQKNEEKNDEKNNQNKKAFV